ncbi:hypothetical protein [Hyphomonas sp.]|uniref:hypothetical protein n=1 Tax=Hyphomonas sp. TaxID=87 RepID=UPI00391B240D
MSAPEPPGGPARALILTIHGTNDGVPGKEKDTKWWQVSSGFVRELKTRLSARGLEADVEEFLWGGANSAFAREQGSIALMRRVRQQAKSYDEIHLIGHSHGGNVAVDAARRAAWGRERKGIFFRGKPANITSLTTVGTPFLRPLARNSDYLYALAFVVLMLVAALAFAVVPAITAWNIARLAFEPGDTSQLSGQLTASAISLIFFIPSALLLFQRWLRLRWIGRLKRSGALRANLLSIWHPDDEAIGGLKRAEAFNPVLVSPGTLWSAGHRFGAMTGSAIFVCFGLLILPLVAVLLIAGSLDVPLLGRIEIPNIAGASLNIAVFTILSLGLVFVLAAGLYAFIRLIFAATELLGRGFLNANAVGALKGFAFGGDTGQPLGEVSERPHFYEGIVWEVPAPLAKRMIDETLETLTGFLARHRASLFGVTVGSDWMRDIAEDDDTWNSLIHTTYFAHPEIAERIAVHIAGAHDTPD